MITEERIQEIAAEAARNVCEPGANNALKHNIRAIEYAIKRAISEYDARAPERKKTK